MNTDPVKHRLGRRGAFLLTGGIVWILEALWLIRHHQTVPGVWLLSHGWKVQAVAWAVTGCLAVRYAFRRAGRDAPGWSALAVMGLFVVGVVGDNIAQAVFRGDWWGTYDAALSGGINFGILSWIIIVSGWREPVEMPSFEKGADR